MPNDEHTHEGSEPHEHDDSAPDHTHDAPAAPPPAAPPPPATTTAAVDVGPSAGGLSVRILLTLLGAAAMIGGGFLDWFTFGGAPAGVDAGAGGTEIGWSVLYSTDDPFGASFFTSVGFIAIVLGLLAILGLALRTGWLSRLAGALAIIEVILYGITLYRVPDADLSISEFGLGVWLVLAGGLLVLIGGFLGSRRIVNTTVPAAPVA